MSGRYRADRLRERLLPVTLDRWFRIIDARFESTPLGAVPASSRFGDPALGFAVLYAAESVPCALWEAVIRDRLTYRDARELPLSDIVGRRLVELRSRATLRLIDLRGDAPARLGAPTATVRDRRHGAGSALSSTVHERVPEADGFVYPSRFTTERCVAVFERAIPRLEAVAVVPLERHRALLDALEDYDITLVVPED